MPMCWANPRRVALTWLRESCIMLTYLDFAVSWILSFGLKHPPIDYDICWSTMSISLEGCPRHCSSHGWCQYSVEGANEPQTWPATAADGSHLSPPPSWSSLSSLPLTITHVGYLSSTTHGSVPSRPPATAAGVTDSSIFFFPLFYRSFPFSGNS